MSPWEETGLPPAGLQTFGGNHLFQGVLFWRFFNPWDEEISIPETRLIQKSYIFHNFLQDDINHPAGF